jgi:3-deoxy-manno-octulosonate cytidylyltransferase (CMP-KDO synthetase)
MIQWVYESASQARRRDRLVVATDDERIRSAVEGFGGDAVMTSEDHLTGTDRCAEVASSLDCEVIVDIQGDEPLIDPDLLDKLVDLLCNTPWASIATPMRRCASASEYNDPDCVKVVAAPDGNVLYFSRSPVPHGLNDPGNEAFIHVGIYAFRRSSLLELGRAPRGELEAVEALEQLRALEAGMKICSITCEGTFIGVDRLEDIEKIEEFLSRS